MTVMVYGVKTGTPDTRDTQTGRRPFGVGDMVEAWKWRSPGEIIERLLRVSAPALSTQPERPAPKVRDRYYTQARHLRLVEIMKGRK